MKGAGVRQQSGFACEECRRRKARCDRARPQCGLCVENGTVCGIIEKRPQRGPKKGQLNVMRTRIALLESQLSKQLSGNQDPNVVATDTVPGLPMSGEIMTELDHNLQATIDNVSENFFPQMVGWAELDLTALTSSSSEAPSLSAWVDQHDLDRDLTPPETMSMRFAKHVELGEANPPLMLRDFEPSDLMWADLDQLYFDRVHPVCPMIHLRRYFSWASQENLPPTQACLRSAMRTMAGAVSAQYRGFSEVLYAETRRMLESYCQTQATDSLRLMANDQLVLELIQAWLLVAHYESFRLDERQAMLTAGRAFRLVQIARLYDIDSPDDDSPETAESKTDEAFAEAEERRRTFWLAFTFDHFLCSRNEWPLTLQEGMVSTRLPAPEANFQNSQRIRVPFLSQALAQSGPSTLSPFAECVVLATLQGRCIAHRRASTKESGKDIRGFWTRHESLATAVEKRVNILRQHQTSSTVESDPILLFANMLAHSTVVYLSCAVQRMPWQTVEHQLMANAYEQRASRASSEVVRLAKELPSLYCFKAHPFLPNPLAAATTFLITHANLNEGSKDSVEHLLRLLKNLSDINSLARELLSTAVFLTDQYSHNGGYIL